jgi:hypothetical protein
MIRTSLRLVGAAGLVLSIASVTVSAVPAPEAGLAPASAAEAATPAVLNSTLYEVSAGLVHARVEVIDFGFFVSITVERCWFGESLFLFNGTQFAISDQGSLVVFQAGGRRFLFTPVRPSDTWADCANGGGLVFDFL